MKVGEMCDCEMCVGDTEVSVDDV